MIGLVLVCHSAKLAEAAAELAALMSGEGLHIGIAGGLEPPETAFGTDAARVARAIDEVWSEDGVLVLMDLGSAVLSAELALDLLAEGRRSRVLLTEAPLVEGAVAAAVRAGLGDSLEEVAAEARGALAAKSAQLVPGGEGSAAPSAAQAVAHGAGGAVGGPLGLAPETVPPVEAPPLRLTVHNPAGLHARPAAALVRTAAAWDAVVTVARAGSGRGPVSARSLNAVATLGVRCGQEIEVRASGPQAAEALAAVRRLADTGFEEPGVGGPPPPSAATAPAPAACEAPPAAGTVLRGLPASPGVAVAAARRLVCRPTAPPTDAARDPATEWEALERALADVAGDIRSARDAVAGRAGAYDAAIFDAHLLFLADAALLDPAREAVFRGQRGAAGAWADAVAQAARAWESLADPYLRGRAADLRSVGEQVLGHLLEPGRRPSPPAGGADAEHIVVAEDLTPAQASSLDPATALGVACALGGPTSHGAILARALGIPSVVGVGRALLAVPDGVTLALDGEAGTVTVDPPPAALRAAAERRVRRVREHEEARGRARLPAVTGDGLTIPVLANVARPAEARAAAAAGADGVGLLRTEFLFLGADHLPDEDEQVAAYRAVAAAVGGLPLTVRTLDAGADKPLPYLPLEREDNPFLGVRGLRLGLAHPSLLAGQLRAVLRLAAGHPVRLMFPMVSTVDELVRARELLEAARDDLRGAGVAVPERLEVGIMVEVPAAALLAEAFLPHADFFSLGTNDLAQYTLAAERGNAAVAALADPLHPAVLRLIAATARAAGEAGRAVSVCGEMAGDPCAIPILLGLGVTELSVAAARIPEVKQAVRAVELPAARRLAAEALAAGSAVEVRRLAGA